MLLMVLLWFFKLSILVFLLFIYWKMRALRILLEKIDRRQAMKGKCIYWKSGDCDHDYDCDSCHRREYLDH